MSWGSARRPGLTRTELIVLIAVLAVLLALAVPAIHRAQTAAARSQCVNHLRQLGLATHRYHDTHQKLPPAGRNTAGCSHAAADADRGWAYWLLPHLGHADLAADPGRAPVPAFHCPARRSPRAYHGDLVCDYAGNVGTHTADDRSAGLDGVFCRNDLGPLTLRAITDGTSNTLLFAERRLNLALLETTLDTQDDEPYYRAGWDGDTLRAGLKPPEPDLNDRHFDPAEPHWQFGGSHAAAVNACFADGAVRVVRYGVDPAVFRRACVRDDNQPFNPKGL